MFMFGAPILMLLHPTVQTTGPGCPAAWRRRRVRSVEALGSLGRIHVQTCTVKTFTLGKEIKPEGLGPKFGPERKETVWFAQTFTLNLRKTSENTCL